MSSESFNNNYKYFKRWNAIYTYIKMSTKLLTILRICDMRPYLAQ